MALGAGGDLLGRVAYVMAETYLMGVRPYDGVPGNDYCHDLLPMMLSRGFAPAALMRVIGIDRANSHALRSADLTRQAPRSRYLFRVGPSLGTTSADRDQQLLADGTREAKAYCGRERSHMQQPGFKAGEQAEADAYFVKSGTSLPPPPEDAAKNGWPRDLLSATKR